MKTFLNLILYFIKSKKYFLLPIVIFLGILGFMIIISSGSTLAPFIYAIF
tara:strand:+ start:395 stop:544 length:150 start_codon:yes stop_codon:yes gene_type:complete